MTCPSVTCIGVYLVGALDEDERVRMYDHLDECPECQREFQDLAPVVEFLAGTTRWPCIERPS